MEYKRGAEPDEGKARSLRPAQRLVEIDCGEARKHDQGNHLLDRLELCRRIYRVADPVGGHRETTGVKAQELSIDPDYLRHLIVKVRSFMAKEDTDLPDDGSNPIDDEMPPGALQEEAGDLSREEVIEEIQGLTSRQRAELVALMWLGRGDAEPEEWNELVARAFERREVPTENYLLDHPQLAEHWLDGMERLNLGGLVGETE